MKNEEYRQSTPSDDRTPLPKGETRPCMRGVLDIELYNRTGEVKMIEPFKEYVSPINISDTPEFNPETLPPRKRSIWIKALNPNKPTKARLEENLRTGMSTAEISKKYKASTATVFNWIRNYCLQGIRGKTKPYSESLHSSLLETRG